MYFGKIVEIGDKNKIFNHPLHPYTLSLIDSIPLPDPLYEQNRGKLSRYNPAKVHDYSVDKPELREVEPNHFVLCNKAEFEEYQAKVK
jgi:oligopeptide transport system ATP-binding protein